MHTINDIPTLVRTCPCGQPGTIYADDGRVALCGKCFIAIYYPELREEAKDA